MIEERFYHIESVGAIKRTEVNDDNGVSTGSGSDRVTVLAISTVAYVETRSLVPTSSRGVWKIVVPLATYPHDGSILEGGAQLS
jgi:hypothetical protein